LLSFLFLTLSLSLVLLSPTIPPIYTSFSFFFHLSRAHRDLHSFPTRRSSDLTRQRARDAPPRQSAGSRRSRCSPTSPTPARVRLDRKSTRLNSSHQIISYAVFCLKKKKKNNK